MSTEPTATVRLEDDLGVEGWFDEGGRLGTRGEASTEARAAGSVLGRGPRPARRHVLIAGGGVAGLETLLALRALASDRVDITVLSPELKFINRSMAVDQPFKSRRARGLRMDDTASEFGAQWHRGTLDRLETSRRIAVTRDGDELPYDVVVLALGADPEHGPDWRPGEVLTYHDGRDGPNFELLLHQLSEGRIGRLVFVKPSGASWPLPLYDLALMTAARCAEPDHPEVELSLITPEEEPLGIFGTGVSAAIRRLLAESGVTLLTSSYALQGRWPGWLDISPGHRSLRADRVVTQARLFGPRLRGVPCDRDGFIHTDSHGRVPGLDGVFAAGDATDFPIKQGGLAAQQADAVAETIAASVGVDIDPQPFRPVLRGLLLTGDRARFLQADISGRGDDSHISEEALWWPPNKLAGRYLAPYLSSQVGEAADVMPSNDYAIPVEIALAPAAHGAGRNLGEVSHPPVTKKR